MEYAYAEGVHWRKDIESWLKTHLGHETFNPNDESDKFFKNHYPNVNFREIKNHNIKLYKEIAEKLVEIDTNEIAKNSDYVICYWDDGAAKGAGTKGEITMAKYFNKPVYLVTSHSFSSIPGWVIGCATHIFNNFDELKNFLLNTYKK
ncbi:MAG: hypothetical protein IGBAC_1749 [Ignavibacteriae bacterium]|nr:MAG: hypothetical protein IGBAC_1749 [Ignavibacteriota bacterium]